MQEDKEDMTESDTSSADLNTKGIYRLPQYI